MQSMALSHDALGDGPTVLLIHSTACDRRMWDRQMPALAAAGYRAVRCDLRGFGETPAPDRPYDDARDVLELLDVFGADRVALIAASGGGAVALEVAARWPGRVAALALLSTGYPEHEATDELKACWERENALIEAGDIAGAVDFNVQTWLGPDADEAAREKLRDMQRRAFEIQLAVEEEFGAAQTEFDLSDITAPSLLVHGSHDLPDFRLIADRLVRQLPAARHLELPWAGHLPNMERPDEINALLLGFLRETYPAQTARVP